MPTRAGWPSAWRVRATCGRNSRTSSVASARWHVAVTTGEASRGRRPTRRGRAGSSRASPARASQASKVNKVNKVSKAKANKVKANKVKASKVNRAEVVVRAAAVGPVARTCSR